jgi:hypothetical protein
MNARPVLLTVAAVMAAGLVTSAQNDLNEFMQQVMSRRDDNWKKLQQYILDERETVELRGPARVALFGERRDYTWFVRDGFFVRSPTRVNGAAVGDDDRQKYEDEFLARQKKREVSGRTRRGDAAPAVDPPQSDDAPRDVDGLIRQTRQPSFISSAYFLGFKFDEGRYALVGREPLDGREVLKVEYYPTKLFVPQNRVRVGPDNGRPPDRRVTPPRAQEAEMMRLMNKSSKVTLWIEPALHQIVKYDFDDLGWDFFPSQWLIRVSDAKASMTMGEMFPGIWLPRSLQMHVQLQLAVGPVGFDYGLDYHDYRQPDVSSTIRVPDHR